MTSYPAHRETDVVLRDGRTIHLRPARPEDRSAVEDYLLALSPESRRLRFWGVTLDIGETAAAIVEIDHRSHESLLALTGSSLRTVVGGARFIGTSGASAAEMGVSVADELQGLGLGSLLIAHLAEAAAEEGITWLHADVLPENHAMLQVFRESGYPITVRAQPGIVEVDLPTAAVPGAVELYEERERLAAASAVRAFLQPTSIAVIGASRDISSIGGRLLGNLLAEPFDGVIYPVNQKADAVQGVTAYPSVLDVPGSVDVAFVAVPATAVSEVARACAEKGVRSLIVISAGFRESGGEGAKRQAELVDICRSRGMRLIGPNCMGIVNTDPNVRLNGTFASVSPHDGRIGFMSQSGALGIAVMNLAESLGIGSVVVRLDRQQGRHLGERPAQLLAGRRTDRRDPALPRVVREPSSVRAALQADRPRQADRRREERPRNIGHPSDRLAHGSAPRFLRHDGGGPLPPERRDPDGHARGDVRRRHAAREPAGPAWTSGRDRDQRGRSRHPVRGRVRGGRPGGAGALDGNRRSTAVVPPRRGGGGEPGRHGGLGARPRLRRGDRGRRRRPEHRRPDRDLHPSPGARRARHRTAHGRGDRDDRQTGSRC